jgi:hypothetical protein
MPPPPQVGYTYAQPPIESYYYDAQPQNRRSTQYSRDDYFGRPADVVEITPRYDRRASYHERDPYDRHATAPPARASAFAPPQMNPPARSQTPARRPSVSRQQTGASGTGRPPSSRNRDSSYTALERERQKTLELEIRASEFRKQESYRIQVEEAERRARDAERRAEEAEQIARDASRRIRRVQADRGWQREIDTSRESRPAAQPRRR